MPIDAEAFGFWLKAAFGAPTTTGTANKTHTFKSGNWSLPSMAIEVGMSEIPRFAMYTGCVLDQISWQMQRSGLLTADAKLIGLALATVWTTVETGWLRMLAGNPPHRHPPHPATQKRTPKNPATRRSATG